MDKDDLIRAALEYAKLFVGRPYVWGGSNAVWGYDCSGFSQEVLRSVGMDQPHDQTAQELYDYFIMNGERNTGGPGAILFFGNGTESIEHVAIQLNDFQMIEAGGGGPAVTSPEIASTREAAMVRIRPMRVRRDFVDVVMPDYGKALGRIT